MRWLPVMQRKRRHKMRRLHREQTAILATCTLGLLLFVGVFQSGCRPGETAPILRQPPGFEEAAEKAAVENQLIASIEAQWSRLPKAKGSLKVPRVMEGGEPYDMALAISAVESLTDLHKTINDLVRHGTIHDKEGFRVSASLQAIATSSDAFDITPITPSETFLADSGAAWRWRVVPKKSGDQEIQVILNVKLLNSGSWRYVTSYAEKVTIHVRPWDRTKAVAANNWQWGCTAIFLPVLALGARVWRRRRDAKSKDPAPLIVRPFGQ